MFADQNLIADPPFSQLDLICCRNVLIYLKPDMQQKVLALFHFSLRHNGYLMLGTAETIGRKDDLFETVSKRWRIYRSMGPTRRDRVSLPISAIAPRREIAATVEEAMRAALKIIAEHNGWRVGHLWRISEDESREMECSGLWHFHGDMEPPIRGLDEFCKLTADTRFAVGEGFVGEVMKTGQPQWSEDIAEHSDSFRRGVPELGLHAIVAFPITIDGEVVAVMEFLSDHKGNPFPRFLEIIPDIGIQLGHVVARKRLEQIVVGIASEEQRRIGRELHDGIAQQLTGGELIAESLRRSVSLEHPELLEGGKHLIDILSQTHRDVRQLSSGLLPETIESVDLLPALRRVCVETIERFNVPCEVDGSKYDESFVENDSVAFAVYQIAREAVHNAIKHSDTSRIVLEIASSHVLRMTVSDKGSGFNADHRQANSNGLRIMRYRAESVGGGLEVVSAMGKGSKVVLTIPRRSCKS